MYHSIEKPWKKYKFLCRFWKLVFKNTSICIVLRNNHEKVHIFTLIYVTTMYKVHNFGYFNENSVSFFHGFMKQPISRTWIFKAIWNNGVKSSCLYIITFKIITIFYHSIEEPWKKYKLLCRFWKKLLKNSSICIVLRNTVKTFTFLRFYTWQRCINFKTLDVSMKP